MERYEILILSKPDLSPSDVESLEERVSKLIESFQGKIISFDKWGKYRLSFPVKKNEHGIYMLARFSMEGSSITNAMKELETFFRIKLDDVVLRHIIKKISKGTSLEYEKPQAATSMDQSYRVTSANERGSFSRADGQN